MMTDDILPALRNFVEVWGDGLLACHVGESLSCIEVEALSRLLAAAGDPESGKTWIEQHGYGDDCDDSHCQCDDEDCIAERTSL